MDESHRDNDGEKKPDTKQHILHDSTHEAQKQRNHFQGVRIVIIGDDQGGVCLRGSNWEGR